MKRIVIITSVLALLSAGVLIALNSLIIRCNTPRFATEMAALDTAFERYRIDYGKYPEGNSASIAQALIGRNGKNAIYIEWKRMSKEGFMLDPWGRPYLFSYTPEGYPLIRSLGEDGIVSSDDKTNEN